MNATWAALIGALIGGITAVVSAALTSAVAYRNESNRQKEDRQSAYVAALREQVSIAFSSLYELQHAVNWITWTARFDAAAVDEQMMSKFDAEVHAAYPKVLSAMAMIAGLNLNVYEQLEPLVHKAYDLEGETALALRGLRGDRNTAIATLGGHLLPRVMAIEESLPQHLARIMKLAQQQQRP